MKPEVSRTPTPGTKMKLVFDFILQGHTPSKAALMARVAPATGERVYEKYVLPMRLRQRISELEAKVKELEAGT